MIVQIQPLKGKMTIPHLQYEFKTYPNNQYLFWIDTDILRKFQEHSMIGARLMRLLQQHWNLLFRPFFVLSLLSHNWSGNVHVHPLKSPKYPNPMFEADHGCNITLSDQQHHKIDPPNQCHPVHFCDILLFNMCLIILSKMCTGWQWPWPSFFDHQKNIRWCA